MSASVPGTAKAKAAFLAAVTARRAAMRARFDAHFHPVPEKVARAEAELRAITDYKERFPDRVTPIDGVVWDTVRDAVPGRVDPL